MFDCFKRKGATRLQREAAVQGLYRSHTIETYKNRPAPVAKDDEFDSAGVMFGYATGLPVSPTRGVSLGAVVGASLHSSNQAVAHSSAPSPAYDQPAPSTDCSPSYDSPSPSSSCDPGSSSSSSSDSSSF